MTAMDINAVNNLTFEDFVSVFGNVVEKCPIVAAAVCSQRPFNSLGDLENAICDFINALPETGKEGILRCHPDLAGRDLHRGTLTKESQEEQATAGLDTLESNEASRMAQLNQQYKTKFGFPFVICARNKDKDRILQQLTERCGNDVEQERERGIEEVKKICSLRLQALVHTETKNKL